MYSAVENDTQCVPVCNRWRLKAEYHVERSGNSMPRGRILELKNNYGIIDTDAYKVEHEWIPYRIEKSMLEEKEGKQYIKYTDEVEFSLSQSQGVRDRDIKEATDIRFIGDEWKYQERIIENNAIQNIRKRLSEYNFYYPILDDKEFVDWLEGNNFQPRMLEYLSPGIFTCKEIIKMQAGKHVDLDCIDAKFKIGLLFVIDRIDIEFRKNILSWITGIENAYKTYFNRIRIADDGYDVGAEVISEWVAKKPKIAKLIKRARDKRRYRGSSDEFDYLTDENAVPLLDLMEQLELNELSELITIFCDVYSRKDSIPDILHKMKECIGFISDLCAIRNAAAHGRSILPTFMDPDYNGNWDLEFDNVEGRCSVEKWILYDLLKKKWERMGLGDYSKQIVNTLYGNPLRRAWIELNYIYFYIIREIEKMSFKLFVTEAEWFLSKEEDIRQQMSGVNLCSLRLSDMGNTTLGVTAPPYDEIAQEAFSVWELFEGKYR